MDLKTIYAYDRISVSPRSGLPLLPSVPIAVIVFVMDVRTVFTSVTNAVQNV